VRPVAPSIRPSGGQSPGNGRRARGEAGPFLFGRPKGANLAEIMKATDWQAHSVRGFLSTAAKKHALKIESAKNEGGERTYKIAK
jgi:Protein of unknown function (DUF3489)